MYEAQTEQVIKQRMLDSIVGIIDKLEGSLTYDAIAPVALELASLYTQLDSIITLVFAQTSSGEYLDKRANEFGVTRKAGTKAMGVERFTGTDGTLIPAGTQLQTNGGLIFVTLADATIANGSVDVNIEAQNIGTDYNVPNGAISLLSVQIVGVTAVTNPNGLTGGADVETDSALLSRLQLKVRLGSTSGNANDYKLWTLGVTGVGDAKVFPLATGNGTVRVVIADSNKQPANASIVSAVQTYIDSVRPIGVTVTVASAQALTVNVAVTINRDSNYTVSQVISNITTAITNYFKSIAFKGGYVSFAQVGSVILGSAGVLDYSNLTLNGATQNITIGLEQVPVIGTVTVN